MTYMKNATIFLYISYLERHNFISIVYCGFSYFVFGFDTSEINNLLTLRCDIVEKDRILCTKFMMKKLEDTGKYNTDAINVYLQCTKKSFMIIFLYFWIFIFFGSMAYICRCWNKHLFCWIILFLRLIKGDGEVLEQIVSRERHKEINKQATKGDGEYFQARLKMNTLWNIFLCNK